MTLAERIQEQRRRCGMSQEKLAELVGVSRQAVTKWESGQSAPNTENLFRLAEIFGVTVDLLLDSGGTEGDSPAEQIYYLYKLEEEKKKAARRAAWKRNLRAAAWLLGCWLLIFVAGVLASPSWSSNEHALLGVVFESYPFSWLLQNGLFGLSMTVCLIPALFGRWKFSAAGTGGFALALLLGTLFGENPAGAAYGHDHYGWAIWGGVFLLSLAMGAVLERIGREGLDWKSKKLWIWCGIFLAGSAAITAAVVLTMPQSFS